MASARSVSLGSAWVTPGSAGVMNLATATAAPTCACATDRRDRDERPPRRNTTGATSYAPSLARRRAARTRRPHIITIAAPVAPRAPGHSAEPSQPIAIDGREHRLEREDDRRRASRSCAPSPRSAGRRSRTVQTIAMYSSSTTQPRRQHQRPRLEPRELGQRRRRHVRDAQLRQRERTTEGQRRRDDLHRRQRPRVVARRAPRDLHDGERVDDRAADGVAGRRRSSARPPPGR